MSDRSDVTSGPFYEGCEKRGGVCDCAGRPCSQGAEAPEGIEAHIGHRLSLTGGEDAPLGLFCDSCGEYLIEWDDALSDITAPSVR